MSRISAVVSILMLAVLAAIAAYLYSAQNARYEANRAAMDKMNNTVKNLQSEINDVNRRLTESQANQSEANRAFDEYNRRKSARPVTFLADVVSCDPKTGEITLSIGSAMGLTHGVVLSVYRDALKICEIRVDRVLETLSFASVIPSSITNPDLRVKPGDTARSSQ